MSDKRCASCRLIEGHHYKCPNATVQEAFQWLEARIVYLAKDAAEQRRLWTKWFRLSNMWHGKYAIVKHENNMLRRKLSRQGRREE